MNKVFSYFKSALSEANGTGSVNRLSGFICIICFQLFGFIILWKVRQFGELWIYSDVAIICGLFGLKTVEKLGTKDSTAQQTPDQKNAN